MYDANIWVVADDSSLHNPHKPEPTLGVLALHECKCDGKDLVVAIHRNCSQYLALVLLDQECVIHKHQWMTMSEGIYARIKCK